MRELMRYAKRQSLREWHQYGYHPFGTWARIPTNMLHQCLLGTTTLCFTGGCKTGTLRRCAACCDMWWKLLCSKHLSSCWFWAIPFVQVAKSSVITNLKENFFFFFQKACKNCPQEKKKTTQSKRLHEIISKIYCVVSRGLKVLYPLH